MNPDLLKPFDLEAARNNEPVLWNGKDVEFVGIDNQGGIALCIDGLIRIASKLNLRMRPLAWVEERPVYKGDVLYSKYGEGSWTVDSTDGLAYNDIVRFKEGGYAYLKDCTWTKPAPVKKTRTVKFLGYMRGDGRLVLLDESKRVLYKRVPSEDKTCEVEE